MHLQQLSSVYALIGKLRFLNDAKFYSSLLLILSQGGPYLLDIGPIAYMV